MAIDIFLFREIAAATLLFFLTRFFLVSLLKPARNLPPGPKGWPIIGALPLLGTMPHVSLAQMAKKYGPIFYLRMGTCDVVVASTPASARAFLKILDTNFSNRPPNASATHLAYDSQDLVFADYGQRWTLLRKLCNVHMLGQKALNATAHIRAMELGHMLRVMVDSSERGELVLIPELLTYAMANVIGQVLIGRRVFVTCGLESNEFKDMVVELLSIAGLSNVGDFIPAIAWMDLQGIVGRMKKMHSKWDALITKIVAEHSESAHRREGSPDFLDVLMASREQKSKGNGLSITNIKALILNLFVAGTDTSFSVIEWALAEMILNPVILNWAQQEMDQVIGKNRRLQESDVPKLPYLQALCKETYRKHPSVPNVIRIASEACEVNGYYIPNNTSLSVNIWAIGRDIDIWENPSEFNPERFLNRRNTKMDPRGTDFELIPFGAGRRICAGTRMGFVMVEYFLGTLVHSFDWKLPDGMVELNMDETFGVALQKAVPLAAMVIPRLHPSAYAM